MSNNPPQPNNSEKIQHLRELNKRLNLLLFETDAVYHEAAKRLGLADSDMKILYTLCHLGQQAPLADVIRLSGINKQTINSALRKLEKQDILYLQNANGRRKLLCLTSLGQQLVEKTVLRLIELENEAMLNWTDQETDLYIELTQRFFQDFKAKIQKL